MVHQSSGWWQKRLIAPRLAGLLVICLTLLITHRQLPMLLELSQGEAVRDLGILLWPLILLPWLVGLPRRWQVPALSAGVVAAFWLLGLPILTRIDGYLMPVPPVLLPELSAVVVGYLLLTGVNGLRDWRWINLLLAGSAALGCALLLVVIYPVSAALQLLPGAARMVASDQLAFTVAEQHELSTTKVSAYTYGEVLVVLGEQEWLWRNANGQTQIRLGSYELWRTQTYCDGERLYIVEQGKGRVECYHYPDGQLLWQREGLGEIDDVAWADGYGWFLNCPDLTKWTQDPQILLHRLDPISGRDVVTKVTAPAGRYWKSVNGQLAELEATEEQVWVRGWCALKRPTGPDTDYSATDEEFIFRPAQGGLRPYACLVPKGLGLVFGDGPQLNYYLTGDLIIELPENAIRARSLATGEEVWRQSLADDSGRGGNPEKPFPVGDRVLVNSARGVLCLEAGSGRQCWVYPDVAGLYWAQSAGEDVVLCLGGGTIVRVDSNGQVVWQSALGGVLRLEELNDAEGTLTVRSDGGLINGKAALIQGGSSLMLSLADGGVLPPTGVHLDDTYFAIRGDFVWLTNRFIRTPNLLNGDLALYRLGGPSVMVWDRNLGREDMLVRENYLLVAEQAGQKVRLVMLAVDAF